MKRLRFVGNFALLLTFLVGLTGCGDSNLFESMAENDSQEAQIEKSVALMNDSRYIEARVILLSIPDQDDPTVRKYLASTYVGSSGFDLLKITSAIAAAQEQDGSGDSVALDAVYDLLGFDDNGKLDVATLKAKEDGLSAAIDLLRANNLENPDPDTTFQLGFYALIDTALLIERMFVVNNTALDFTNSEVVTDAEIAAAVNANFESPESSESIKDSIERNLALVAAAQDTLIAEYSTGDSSDPEEQNDLAEDFDVLLTDIGYDKVSGKVNSDTLSSYLMTLND